MRPPDRPLWIWLSAAAIGAAGVAAYWGSLGAPFIFDDLRAVVQNPTIRHLWPLQAVWAPSAAESTGVTGRPLVNFSYALNYACGGLDVRGYHLANLAIHLLAGLTLFGIVRRTAGRTGLAWVVALLWTVHPLQTESVTCIMQRTESLMGLFYLLTLYCFIRSSSAAWAALSVLSCLLGMLTKEVMVTAPLIVLLYDRAFVSASFSAAWARRKRYYLALAATWLVLAYLVAREGGIRGRATGTGEGSTVWHYALTQCWAIGHYLRLAIWPHPLVLDYGTGVVGSLAEVWPQAVLVVAAVAGFGLMWGHSALFRRAPWLAFLGAWFFLILGPSSSFVPLAEQTVAEHRMYLPLAAVIVGAVLAADRWWGRTGLLCGLGLAVAGTLATARRNTVYRSEIAIWGDTAAHRPANPRAHNNLGAALVAAGRLPEAAEAYRAALRLKPDYADARTGLGRVLSAEGRSAEAVAAYREALRLRPDDAEAENNLGNELAASGDLAAAVEHYTRALALRPDLAEAAYNLQRVRPAAEFNLANSLFQSGQSERAREHYESALRADPALAEAHNNLGVVLVKLGQRAEGLAHFRRALELKPDYADARRNLDRWSAVK